MSIETGSEQRVLIVEDEPDIRTLIGLVLDSRSVAHEDAVDGGDALRRLAVARFGAVILDLMMPGVDGFAVLDAVRAGSPALLPRFIVVSGATPEVLARVDADVFRVLTKPLLLADLCEAVRECLARSRRG